MYGSESQAQGHLTDRSRGCDLKIVEFSSFFASIMYQPTVSLAFVCVLKIGIHSR